MKQSILLCLLMLLCTQIKLNAQAISEMEIVGIWKVKKAIESVDSLPADIEAIAARMRKDFIGSTFQFSPDHYVTFKCPKRKTLSFQAANWVGAGDGNRIIIQSWQVAATPAAEIVRITPMMKDGKAIFMIDELFSLEMERVIVKKERY